MRVLVWLVPAWLVCVLPIAYLLSRTDVVWASVWVSLSSLAMALVAFLVSRRPTRSMAQILEQVDSEPASAEKTATP
jgi:hypothetical protein